ncbi:hypothetical protein NEOLEDRAFT_1080794 [Neolentinus lepideus HHB14362 ss-1]|uniref:Uncharacterized protein n=1 Tax=Neolentinus lepideus HHB14362 ss-1 TaxID=1314782 RepID=A0A165MCZ8_9AGAM|nr:hypothetical protein NEOLEDRAFT_1080794 [Neolentinus lepideus HHB14362 ss-1]
MVENHYKHNIALLHVYLQNLPDAVPFHQPNDSLYGFHSFAPDKTWLREEGLEMAVNQQLEVKWGPRTEIAPIRERGHGIEAVVDVLAQYLGALPDSVLLHKWLEDITASTKLTYLREAGHCRAWHFL